VPDYSHTFGGGAVGSVLSPIVGVALVLAILLVLLLPRKYVIVPVLLFIFLTPLGQQLYVGGVHWLVSRVVILAGLARLVWMKLSSKKELMAGGINGVDKAFFGYAFFQAVSTVLLYMQSQALVNQFGFLIDFMGAYFLMRCLIQDETDIYRALKCLALLTAVIGISMMREQLQLQNTFGLLGGFRLVPEIREGKIRSQGVFQHSILAGVFGAVLLPLFFMLWKNGKAKVMGAVGMVGASVMTWTSQSSTPLLAYAAGLLGICLWPIRKKMKNLRWGLVAAILLLAIVMKAPVWFIIAHIDLTGGSSGYHRAELVDQFIRHFSNWWLIGTKDASTWGWDMWDVQNQYVDAGETGGLAAFVLFIALISRSFARIGNARKVINGDKNQEWYLWFLGSALFANCLAFIGANYFDQTRISWFLLLASISAATAPILKAQTEKVQLVAGAGVGNAGFGYAGPFPSRTIAKNPAYKNGGELKNTVR
jgi:hypothetical protein